MCLLRWLRDRRHIAIENRCVIFHYPNLISRANHCHPLTRSDDWCDPVTMLNQLIKDCHLIIHNTTLLINENIMLCTANQKQQCKCSKPVSSISQGGILTIQEGQLHTQSIENIREGGKGQSVTQPKTRAPLWCSLCSLLKHITCMYAQCYNNNQ